MVLIGAFSYQILICEEFSDAINLIVTVSNYLIINIKAEAGLSSGNSVISIKKGLLDFQKRWFTFSDYFLNGGGGIRTHGTLADYASFQA
tara:strand:+ start:219 stop:488 length:270 start_codon:yes stop_codon:yes gene_type:complete